MVHSSRNTLRVRLYQIILGLTRVFHRLTGVAILCEYDYIKSIFAVVHRHPIFFCRNTLRVRLYQIMEMIMNEGMGKKSQYSASTIISNHWLLGFSREEVEKSQYSASTIISNPWPRERHSMPSLMSQYSASTIISNPSLGCRSKRYMILSQYSASTIISNPWRSPCSQSFSF